MSSTTRSAHSWAAITPSDGTALEQIPGAIRANVGGNVNIVGRDGVAFAFTVAAGETLPCRPTKVMATGTTATGIAALYNSL